MNAVRSVVDQGVAGVRVIVSDNSADDEQRAALVDFCGNFPDDRVRYMKPPSDMSMSEHWEWACREALADGSSSHVTYLTDRMVFKAGELSDLCSLLQRYPDRVLSYNHDKVEDFERPIRLELAPWSGKLFEIDSSHLLFLSAKGVFHACLPRMLNCIVPRIVVEHLDVSWGGLFGSISPDFCFAYRCLDAVPTLLYYDRACIVQYALARSNGASQARGVPSTDSKDFKVQLGDLQLNFATPMPGIHTVPNAIFHEYCAVAASPISRAMPAVDLMRYLAINRVALREMSDPKMAEEMLEIVHRGGERLSTHRRWIMFVTDYGFPLWARKLRLAVRHPGPTAELLRNRVGGWFSSQLGGRWLRHGYVGPNGREFQEVANAIRYASRSTDGRASHAPSVLPLLMPGGHVREVSIGTCLQRSCAAQSRDVTATEA